MSAPRIDTFRNTLDAVQQRLDELWLEVADLHDLAYDRRRAVNEKVSGGDPTAVGIDLDNHGDRRARDLYIDAARSVMDLAHGAEDAIKAIRGYLNRGADRPTRINGKTITAEEFDQARDARRRRTVRGERTPHRVVAQPERPHHLDPTVELEQLRGAVRRLAKHLDREHTACYGDNRKRRPRWLDRSTMSPAQRDAFDRALLIDQKDAAAS